MYSAFPLRLVVACAMVTVAFSAGFVTPGELGAEAGSQRVVAIGDIHGEYAGLVTILRAAQLIDDDDRWIGGTATLVQTGDFTDRGPRVRQVMDLLMNLQKQAAEQGGEVIVLLGNHEVMNLVGNFESATPEIYAAWATEESETLREEAWEGWVDWRRQMARTRGGSPPDDADRRAGWLEMHPPGFLEYMRDLAADGKYGSWLKDLPVMVKIGDAMFMHAGVSPEYAAMSVEEINEHHTRQLHQYLADREALAEAGMVPWFFDLFDTNQALVYQSANPPKKKFRDPGNAKLIASAAENLNEMQKILLVESPLWYRGFSNLTGLELQEHLADLNDRYEVDHWVVAHSPLASATIQQRNDGGVFLIDTGMLSSYYGGRASALEFNRDRIVAVYVDGRIVMQETQSDTQPASPGTAISGSSASGG